MAGRTSITTRITMMSVMTKPPFKTGFDRLSVIKVKAIEKLSELWHVHHMCKSQVKYDCSHKKFMIQ